ncbi:MAG: hypothetical protein ACRDBY_08620 [Cetobacterium sp.]
MKLNKRNLYVCEETKSSRYLGIYIVGDVNCKGEYIMYNTYTKKTITVSKILSIDERYLSINTETNYGEITFTEITLNEIVHEEILSLKDLNKYNNEILILINAENEYVAITHISDAEYIYTEYDDEAESYPASGALKKFKIFKFNNQLW